MIGFNGSTDDLQLVYDDNGNLTEEKHYSGDTFIYKYVFEYNDNNQIISQTTLTEDD